MHCGADMIKSLTLGSVCGSGFCQVQFGIPDEHRVYSVSLFLRRHALANNRECIVGIHMLEHAEVNENVIST